MGRIRILVVDDSFFMRKVIGDILRLDPSFDVIGEASNGEVALKKIAELHPDVVTLDIEMPVMNGLETLRAIVSKPHHPAVVMVSGYVADGADTTLQCLAMGAVDFVLKPSGSFSLEMDEVKDLLIEKVHIAATARLSALPARTQEPSGNWGHTERAGITVIGASTGGPAALEYLLPQFPAQFPSAIVVAQHLPKTFIGSFADRLRQLCQLKVLIAEDHMALHPGTIYIASGSTTTQVTKSADGPILSVEPNNTDIETPPINELMQSAADVYGAQTMGIILTGMGTDGAEGMARIKQVGGTCIVQDQASSVVFGMGREAIAKHAADAVVPLEQIAKTVHEALETHE